jgi:phosphatidylglycerophosphatase A
MNTICKLVITGLGTGYMRPAPGTWGSAAVLAILLALTLVGGATCGTINLSLACIVVLASVGCIAFGRRAEVIFGRKDPSQCTIDEWAGQALTYILLPMGTGWRAWLIICGTGFIFFRFFDIVKPPPARQLEKLPAGWGVLLDDLAAGIYANIASQLVLRLALPHFGIQL